MKGRESGMPQKEAWERFFNPGAILAVLGLGKDTTDAAEFGCGYGTFTIPAAQIIRGTLHAFDIEEAMVAETKMEAAKHGLQNIKVVRRDFMAQGTGLDAESVDYAMLFNILHIEHPETLLQEACRILKEGGKLGIIHWNYDASTPRGPSMDIRPKPQQCVRWAKEAGFSRPQQHDLKPHHYGIVLRKEQLCAKPQAA